MKALHPASYLIAWIMLALAMPWITVNGILLLSLLLTFVMLLMGTRVPVMRMLRRSAVLMIMLVTIYALATPGVPIWPPFQVPTWEGVHGGGLQVLRLVVLLMALAMILALLDRTQMLAAIYVLLLPLKPMGLPLEKMTVRLCLTLHYVEQAPAHQGWKERVQNLMQPATATENTIELEIAHFQSGDLQFLVMVGMLLVLLAW